MLEEALYEKTKVVMAAHTLGNPFDLKVVTEFCNKHNLWLIEDNCVALNSMYVNMKPVYRFYLSLLNNPTLGIDLLGMFHKVYITDSTIRNNVALGIDDKEIDDQKVWRALEMAQMKQFVESLPEGIDTKVGEWGVQLSGGQRQRIAIARALYMNPDIIILDEATNALDTEAESAVMESIKNLRGIKTLTIVVHRLTTIAKCDEIYEIVKERQLNEINCMYNNKDRNNI